MGHTVSAVELTESGSAGHNRVGAVVMDATAAADIELRDGGASGPVVGKIRLAAAGTKGLVFGGDLVTAGDLYVKVTTGTPSVYVYLT